MCLAGKIYKNKNKNHKIAWDKGAYLLITDCIPLA